MASLQETSPYLCATGMPTQTIESVEVTTRKIAELSVILIIQKNWESIAVGQGREESMCGAQRPYGGTKVDLSRTSCRSHLKPALIYAKGCDL